MTIELISGVEGYCLTVNDTRICGPKPWGGGKVVKTWHLSEAQVYELEDLCRKQIEWMQSFDKKEEKSYGEEFVANHYFV